MRWLFPLALPAVLYAQEVPDDRRIAPPVSEARAVLIHTNSTHKDSIATRLAHWLLYERRYTGGLYTTHGDTALASLEPYVDGCLAGTAYSLDAHEHITEVIEYAADNTSKGYRYDPQGRLTQHCTLQTARPVAFDRIFGGREMGTCWSFDTLGRVTDLLDLSTDNEQTIIHYYPNGQLAERRWHSVTVSRIEQWCPSGKRVSYASNVVNSSTGTSTQSGYYVQWSVTDHSYYLAKAKNGRISLRRVPGGRWRTYTQAEYTAVEKQLRLRNVCFNDPERPVELPCGLPRR